MRVVAVLIGLTLGAVGGVIAYRALFIEPSAAVFITNAGSVREMPNTMRVAGGIALLTAGAALAFFAARRRR